MKLQCSYCRKEIEISKFPTFCPECNCHLSGQTKDMTLEELNKRAYENGYQVEVRMVKILPPPEFCLVV